MSRTVGLIPARGGSKGLPNKNVRSLCGQPLISYSIAAALQCHCLDQVVVSTDNQAIADIAGKHGAQVPFIRPQWLSADETPAVDVMLHAVYELEHMHNKAIDTIVYLQPTSPFRTSAHIAEAIRLFYSTGADTVVSVVRVPHQYTPGSIFELDLDNKVFAGDGARILRRQDKPKYYARNGPAILVISTQVIKRGELYGNSTVAMEMTAAESIDIDTELDLAVAECIMQKATD